MKRITTLLICLFFLLNCAYADEKEICFQNIPWLTNEFDTMKSLEDIGYLRKGASSNWNLSKENNVYIVTDNEINYRPDLVMSNETVCFSTIIKEDIKGKIAGCPISDIILTFAYDGEYKLIAVKIDLINSNYNDIKKKIYNKYGEGEYNITTEGIESTIWKGADNSAILLYTDSNGLDYTLMYGRLDASEILSNCYKIDPDDVSGL